MRPRLLEVSEQDIERARAEVAELHLADVLEDYIVEIVQATRGKSRYGKEAAADIAFGASPRGSIALERCARAKAWLSGREYVTPEDVQQVAEDVLRHRVLVTYEAEARGVTSSALIDRILQAIPLP